MAMAAMTSYEEDKFGFTDSDIARVFAVIGCGIAYIVLFVLFGYFLSTLASLCLILLAFGNGNFRTIAIMSVVGAVIYQLVFMGLMGLHDPAGLLIDARPLTQWFSGG